MSILVFSTMTPHETVAYDSIMGYAILIAKEAVTGLIIGFGVELCNSIVSFAGRIIDMEIGLSMANLVDPTTKEMTSISGVLYHYLIMLMLIITGMYQYLIQAIVDTFILIPVSGAIFHTDSMFATMLEFLSDYIIIGFRICLPVFAVMIMLNAILGVLAKVAPQLNMFAVGIQIKVLTGITILFLTVDMLPGAADFIFTQMKKIVVSFVEGMM